MIICFPSVFFQLIQFSSQIYEKHMETSKDGFLIRGGYLEILS